MQDAALLLIISRRFERLVIVLLQLAYLAVGDIAVAHAMYLCHWQPLVLGQLEVALIILPWDASMVVGKIDIIIDIIGIPETCIVRMKLAVFRQCHILEVCYVPSCSELLGKFFGLPARFL